MTAHDVASYLAIPPGTVLGGRYEVGELLGMGGSASVFGGRDARLGRPVAIKVLHPRLAADAASRAAFQVEATAAAMLSHPGIVAVHDVGTDEVAGTLLAWIAMERVRGTTLRDHLTGNSATTTAFGITPRGSTGIGAGSAGSPSAGTEHGGGRRGLPFGTTAVGAASAGSPSGATANGSASAAGLVLAPADALDLIADVLSALDHAHKHGVVHRDISPGNVMITDEGAVKVLDFGLATADPLASTATAEERAVVGEQSERTEVVRGSVAYVSPEQAQGLPVDRRSDLYSVGCLLFALLTGSPPYVAATVGEVAKMHVTALVPLASSRVPSLSHAVDTLLSWALAKSPAARPATAEAFRDEVLRIAAELRDPDRMHTTVIPRVSTTTSFRAVRQPTGPVTVPVPVARQVAERRRPEPARIVQAQPLVTPNGGPPDDGGRGVWPATLFLVALALVAAGVLWFMIGRGEPEPSDITIPDVAGQTTAAARETLATASIRDGGVRTEPHDTVPSGRVIRTDPPANQSVAANTPVVLIVSGGPQSTPTVGVPQLEGAGLAEARTMLEAADLVLGELRRQDSARAADIVLSSEPAAGAQLAPGTVVALTLASGNQVVPTVVGLELGEARALVQDAGFTVAETPAAAAPGQIPGTVVAVQPAAGSSLRLGSTVTLVVAAEPVSPPATLPSDTPPATPPPSGEPTQDPSPSQTPTPTGPILGTPTETPSGTPTETPGSGGLP